MNARSQGVLVLEDDPEVAELSVMLLAAQGYRAHSVATVADALASIQLERPSCVLVDYDMEGADGLDFARKVRGDHAGAIMLIATTGWRSNDPRVKELKTLFDHFFEKPVDWDSCFAALKAI